MAAKLWFLTDRRIREDYPQKEILRALKAKCCEEELDFRAVVMDEVVLTIEQRNLGLRINGELITAYPQVVVVRVPTSWKMGCRLMNRPQAILNCVNKFWTFQELAGHGVPLPDTFSYGGHENFAKMIAEAEVLEFPMVVKNTRGHRGKAVFLARDKHHLADLSHLIRHEAPYLFQKYVKESPGRDVRVIVVGGHVVGTMLRCSTDGRMQSNCSLGGVGMMCSLSEQGRQLAIQVSNILGTDVCGIDLLMKDDGFFCVCEANANVGFIAFDKACNLDVAGVIADYAASLLPSGRLTRRMSLLSVVSTASETSEPELGPPASTAVDNMSASSIYEILKSPFIGTYNFCVLVFPLIWVERQY
uniref:N-acetylaspartylglutamate synthase n=1 Tax=Suricata suricatta TaxID=37032 RepID=A0A673SN10_SURSU